MNQDFARYPLTARENIPGLCDIGVGGIDSAALELAAEQAGAARW